MRLSQTRKYTNVLQGKIICKECNTIMHQKVNLSARVNQYVCKNKGCYNSVNREWLYEMVRLGVEEHIDRRELDNLLHEKRTSSLRKEYDTIKNKKQKKEADKTKLIINKDKVVKSKGYNYYRKKLDNLESVLGELIPKEKASKEKYDKAKRGFRIKRKRFSKDYEAFKLQIEDILHKVIIKTERVEINIFGWRVYDIGKPNSALLCWDKRDMNKPYIYRLYNFKYKSDDEVLDSLIHHYQNPNIDNIIDEHFESEEYKLKMKGVKSLGGKDNNI